MNKALVVIGLMVLMMAAASMPLARRMAPDRREDVQFPRVNSTRDEPEVTREKSRSLP